MASSGISENGTVTNSSPLEFEIKKAALENSKESYLLVDATKFGKSALLTYASVGDMDKVIVDKGVDRSLIELCELHNVDVRVAETEEEI